MQSEMGPKRSKSLPSNLGNEALRVGSDEQFARFIHEKHTNGKWDWDKPELQRNWCSLEDVVEEWYIKDLIERKQKMNTLFLANTHRFKRSTYNDDNGNADAHSNRNSQVPARTPEWVLLENR